MQKKNKVANSLTINGSQQGYHQIINFDVDYAFQGFTKNYYFTSDRTMELDSNFNRKDGKDLKGFGLEIECSCDTIKDSQVLAMVLDNIAFKPFPNHLFKQQRDGSLRGLTSSECITQVMTKEFIRNNYANFQYLYDVAFKKLGVTCDNGSCGMHCNISNGVFGRDKKTQDDAIRKLYYIINKHFDVMCIMLNRDRNRTNYCSMMDYNNAKTMNLKNRNSDHAVSFNLGHYEQGRIEIRLVGGQKNFACFRNTMETIFFLTERVKEISWSDCDDLKKIFKGCNKYVYDRLTVVRNNGLLDYDTLNCINVNVDLVTAYL